MLQQVVWILPCHIFPFQTVGTWLWQYFNNLLSILPPWQNNPVTTVWVPSSIRYEGYVKYESESYYCPGPVKKSHRCWGSKNLGFGTTGMSVVHRHVCTAAVPEDDLITAKALSAIDWPFSRSTICRWFCQPPTSQRWVVVDVPAVYKIYRVDSWPGSTTYFLVNFGTMGT